MRQNGKQKNGAVEFIIIQKTRDKRVQRWQCIAEKYTKWKEIERKASQEYQKASIIGNNENLLLRGWE